MHTKKDGLLFPPVEVDCCMRKGRLFCDFWLVLLGDVWEMYLYTSFLILDMGIWLLLLLMGE